MLNRNKLNFQMTVLPCVNKVYEVLLGQQVSKFMDRLSDAITVYHANNSCETTLIRMTETWRAELDSKKIFWHIVVGCEQGF